MADKNYKSENRNNRPKEPEWIDLEKDMPEEDFEAEEPVKRSPKKQPAKRKPAPKKKAPKINFHVILLSLIAVIFVIIIFKLVFWDKRVRENNELENDTTLSFDTEPLDSIVPLDASDTSEKEKDNDLRILFIGNGSLADDKTSDTNMANIVQKKTGATVYNCAIPGSYMSLKNGTYDSSYPYDAFSFFPLCTLFTVGNTENLSLAERDLGGLPEEVKEPLDLLQSIDYDELDVLCIYYDAADYLEQRVYYNLENEMDVCTFAGALAAGLDLIQEVLPNTRIIVMSPTYVYVPDENGNYTSSYLTDIKAMHFTAYIGFESQICAKYGVSFVDNLYGSVYEELADEYLKDYILLNEKGHALVADRFLYALNRFNEYDF